MSYAHPKNIMSPVHRSFADPSFEINDLQGNPAKIQFGKKSAKVDHCLHSSLEQLQMAL
jgi:hypothetical protein